MTVFISGFLSWLVWGILPHDTAMSPATAVMFILEAFFWLLVMNIVICKVLRLLFWGHFANPVFYAGQTILLFMVIFDVNYYNVNRQHIDLDGLYLMLSALFDGELGDTAGFSITHVLWLFSGAVLTTAIHLAIRRLPRPRFAAKTAPTALFIPFLALGMLFIADRLAFDPGSKLAESQIIIPWFLFPHRQIDYGIIPEDLPISDQKEKDSIKLLAASRQSLLKGVKSDKSPDILMIHVEGLRYDMINEKNLPMLWARVQKGELENLSKHYTTGNNTGISHHGLLNGLSAFSYQLLRDDDLKEWFAPIPLDILAALGYKHSAYFKKRPSAKQFMWDSVWELFFKKTVSNYFIPPYKDIASDEDTITDHFVNELKKEPANHAPRFDYIVYYSTHYDYYYPEAFAKFKPAAKLGFEISSKNFQHMAYIKRGLFNRYQNSVLWVDHMVDKIIAGLIDMDRFSNTILIITGDHGEEFWEHGRFGHSYGLVNEQIQTGTLIHFPGHLKTRYKVTSHADFFPTIFEYMGLNRDPQSFMVGKSLLQYDTQKDCALSCIGITRTRKNYHCVLIDSDLKIEFLNKDVLKAFDIKDSNDNKLKEINVKKARTLLMKAFDFKVPENIALLKTKAN